MSEFVEYAVKDKVAVIAINRPENNNRNRINAEACDGLVAAFREAERDPTGSYKFVHDGGNDRNDI